ncbi:glycosyltransferase [Lysobacter enzymogenes]|uniref:glycosyltransferase n=1 Tax=Lysobacter enzymogenes TaxID=69 RepID=UPI0008961D0E|nr:glycosyltransferase [Lysobacter enzymogenes]SDX36762.1 Glycosyltransferase involved in cell wall bisynthesis [Lysobacter enzymogenes]
MSAVRSVVLYIPQLKLGGAEISMLRLAQGLQARGIAVALAVHRADPAAQALAGGVELLSLDADRTLAVPGRLARLLRRRRPDVMVSALTHSNIVAVLAARGTAVRTVLTEHAPIDSMRRLDRSSRYRATLALMPWVYRFGDAIVAVSEGVRADIAAHLHRDQRRRVHIIANPVLPKDWRERADAPLDDEGYGADDEPVVLSVGRLSEEKNVAGLIHAFARLRASMRLRLVVVGDGPQRPALQALVDELGLGPAVRLLGQRDNPYPYMRRARVFALASQFEGFGNVLIEAMACGAPVVSTDCPVGPREVLAGGRYGLLVPPDDSGALAEAIERQVRHCDPQVVAAAREYALQFTVERSAARYLQLFERLLDDAAPRR